MRVLGAVRLSRLTDESTSPKRQRDRIAWWTEGQGGELVHVAEDLDVSGALDPFRREGLGPWLSDDPPEPWDTLVAWKLDRISRSSMDTEKLLNWCVERGKRIVCVDDGIDTSTEMGEVWVRLASIFAQVERRAIKERTLKGKAALRDAGRWGGETPHYGLKPERRDGGWYLVRDETAVPIIHRCVSEALEGRSVASIAEGLTADGVPTPRDHQRVLKGEKTEGKTWNPQTLFKLLTSPKLVTAGLVEAADFRRLQHVIQERRYEQRNRSSDASFLSGVVLCLECGHNLYSRSQTVGGRRYSYYYCPNKHGQSIPADELEEVVEQSFLEAVGDEEVHEQKFIPASDATAELEAATFALDELTESLSYVNSRTAKESIRNRIAELDARIAELEELPPQPARTELQPTGRTYAQTWADGDRDAQRSLLVDSGVRLQVRLTGRERSKFERGLFESGIYVPEEILERIRS